MVMVLAPLSHGREFYKMSMRYLKPVTLLLRLMPILRRPRFEFRFHHSFTSVAPILVTQS
jgi:hypothetical protein